MSTTANSKSTNLDDVVNNSKDKPARIGERVRVFCRLRPLLQREREGWSYEDYCQHAQNPIDTNYNSDTNQHQEDKPYGILTPGSTEPETFITENGRVSTVRDAGKTTSIVSVHNDSKTITYQPNHDKKEFTFDASLSENTDQASVYEHAAQNIVKDVLNGYNGTILAYGQTSTGKTHTMVGPENSINHDQRGIIPRALEDIFTSAEQTRTKIKTTVALSYVQIYCERIFDLLDPELSPSSIVIREDPDSGVYLDGASSIGVRSVEDCLSLFQRGNANRAVASTGMNVHSSRSHAILILRIERKELSPTLPSNIPVIKISTLHLVDLAGSERVKKTNVMGRHVYELKAINLSLSALGNCIAALSSRKPQRHVPYRDSKLTRLLQSSLGGNAMTSLVITVSPSHTEAHETLSTLQFGQRAMRVAVQAQCNVLSVLDYKTLYEDLRAKLDEEEQQTQRLEKALNDAQQQRERYEDQLMRAQIRIHHLEFECQAAKARLETAKSGETETISNSAPLTADFAFAQQLAALVTKHEQDVAKIKANCDLQVETYKKLAQEASQEWHDVETQLATEKTEVLTSLRELKEFKLRYFQLEEETTERIAELVQDAKEHEHKTREENDAARLKLAAQEKELKAVNQKLQETESERDRMREQLEVDFVPRETIEQMEALYEGAISKLQARVGCLETRASGSQKNLATTFQSNNQLMTEKLPPATHSMSGKLPKMSASVTANPAEKGSADATTNGRAVPRIGRLVPASKANSASSGLR